MFINFMNHEYNSRHLERITVMGTDIIILIDLFNIITSMADTFIYVPWIKITIFCIRSVI